MLKELLEDNQNEGFLSKVNNWIKNTEIIKTNREFKLTYEFDTKLEIHHTSIEKLQEENGWMFYKVTSVKNKEYLCFLSSSDIDVMDKFLNEIEKNNISVEKHILNLGKIGSMEKNGITPYFIIEMMVEKR